jgi:radical SAM superfamily enzyme YgiQ (UPF0313 family)
MHIALINTNRIQPPIAPIGLEYIAEALHHHDHEVDILDLCWEESVDQAIDRFFNQQNYDLVGITFRNTDDCAYASRQSFMEEFSNIVRKVKLATDAFVVLGGVGFSIMPEAILEICDVDVGIWGEGEYVFPQLADRIEKGLSWETLHNLIYRKDGQLFRTSNFFMSLDTLPPMERQWFDNQKYFSTGGQAGVETKRGCSRSCIYCADPVAKGKMTRVRSAKMIVEELHHLYRQGINYIHTCDSEFNIPEWHAVEVCKAIIDSHLRDRIRWYAYCAPVPFSKELAELMQKAGCVGINFGIDHGDPVMLKSLRRSHGPDDILMVASYCKEVGIITMFDLLIGAPGETRESVTRTIELMKRANVDQAGIALGVRIYPGTELDRRVKQEMVVSGLAGGANPMEPLFYLEPKVAPFISDYIDQLIGDDDRFLFFNPENPIKNYNYNANELLVEAIQEGNRGAYWDILRRYKKK